MDTLLGTGLATGMFYHAPAGTALPTYPAETLATAWKHVGDVSDAGITLTTDKSTEALRNWANVVKRVIMTEHSETIQTPVMDTTEDASRVHARWTSDSRPRSCWMRGRHCLGPFLRPSITPHKWKAVKTLLCAS